MLIYIIFTVGFGAMIIGDFLLWRGMKKKAKEIQAAADHTHMASIEVSEALAEIKKIRAMYDDEEASAS